MAGQLENYPSIPIAYPDDVAKAQPGRMNLFFNPIDDLFYGKDHYGKLHAIGGAATAGFYANSVATGTPTEGLPSFQTPIVTVDRSGYNDLINVSATNLPVGVFLPDFTIPANTNRVTPTLTTDATTIAGNYNFTLNYRKAGSLLIYTSIQVPLTIVPSGPS